MTAGSDGDDLRERARAAAIRRVIESNSEASKSFQVMLEAVCIAAADAVLAELRLEQVGWVGWTGHVWPTSQHDDLYTSSPDFEPVYRLAPSDGGVTK